MPDRPEDVDAAFAAIVADLEREGVGSRLPELEEPADEPAPETPAPTRTEPPPQTGSAWRGHEGEWDWAWNTDDEHYVPPDPPPLPRLRPLTVVALLLIVAAVVLLVLPGVIGLDARIGTPIALVALTCGGGMLLLRIRQNPKNQDDSRDDGAQL